MKKGQTTDILDFGYPSPIEKWKTSLQIPLTQNYYIIYIYYI